MYVNTTLIIVFTCVHDRDHSAYVLCTMASPLLETLELSVALAHCINSYLRMATISSQPVLYAVSIQGWLPLALSLCSMQHLFKGNYVLGLSSIYGLALI